MCNELHLILFFRRRALQRRAQEAQVSNEEQEEMLRNLERRETEYMRLQRRKIGIDDFEQLTVIGKGAFGEVIIDFKLSIVKIPLVLLLCSHFFYTGD